MREHEAGRMTRREFVRVAGAMGAVFPQIIRGGPAPKGLATRVLGRTGFPVTTMGLGGQASLQWTPPDVEPVAIIARAFDLGVTYFDTSNAYGPSQANFGKAFAALGLAAGRANYDERKRRGVFVASKTMLRSGRGVYPGIRNSSDGPPGSTAVDDIRRSLSQLFGDGRGNYPEGAYIDLFQIHNLTKVEEVEAIYEGLDGPGPAAERIGALAALLDFRDGTDRTGLNPRGERVIRHIGITGHYSSPVLMDCIQRDTRGILDALLVAVNANDRLHMSHQHNVIPVAAAKGMGIIGMKVFADGAMYGREPRWNGFGGNPSEVIRAVGSAALPSAPLIHYSLSVPGIATNIIGIGQVSEDVARCQLRQNLRASQVEGTADAGRLREIEAMAATVREGQTNWFQLPREALGAPREVAVAQRVEGGVGRVVRLKWQTAYAAAEPIMEYAIHRDGAEVARVKHLPQVSREGFAFEDRVSDRGGHRYAVGAVDAGGKCAMAAEVLADAV